jgi:flagellar motor switch protein FliN/FliY
MTESSSLRAFFAVWKESCAAVLSRLGVAEAFAILSPSAGAPGSDAVPGYFLLQGGLRGQLLCSAAPAVAVRLAQQFRSEPIDASLEITDSHRSAFAEFLRQVADTAASIWKLRCGSEIQLKFEEQPAGPFPAASATEIKLSGETLGENVLHLQMDQQLCESLEAAMPEAVAGSAPSASGDAASPANPSAVSEPVPRLAKQASALPQNLDLLLDVELEATIRFGAREMLLRDIFSLMPGAVVELDQVVNEPVELLVAGRLIARGEVVVVDGNFGLRVSEVATPSQRAEVLRL